MGVRVNPQGWEKISVTERRAIALEGSRGTLDLPAITTLSKAVPVKQLVLINKEREPNPDEIPGDLTVALGPGRRVSVAEWRSIRALDRYVLVRLAHNQRLLSRVWTEIFHERARAAKDSPLCSLGHCELRASAEAIAQLSNGSLLDGRAFLLSRAAGVRAARRTGELIDAHADREAGPIELDWAIKAEHGVILWQGHVSTWEGAFFPAASLLAVSTAAIALFDMIRTIDPRSSVGAAGIYETPWQVGGKTSLDDEPTSFFATTGRVSRV